jgi:hypothetical protein
MGRRRDLHHKWVVIDPIGHTIRSVHHTEEAARKASNGWPIGFAVTRVGNMEVPLDERGFPTPLVPSKRPLSSMTPEQIDMWYRTHPLNPANLPRRAAKPKPCAQGCLFQDPNL